MTIIYNQPRATLWIKPNKTETWAFVLHWVYVSMNATHCTHNMKLHSVLYISVYGINVVISAWARTFLWHVTHSCDFRVVVETLNTPLTSTNTNSCTKKPNSAWYIWMWLIWETIIVSKTNKTHWNCVFAQRLKCTCVLLFQIHALSPKSVIKVFTCKPGCLYHCTLYSETHADTSFCKWKREKEVVLYVYLSSTIRNDREIKDKGSQQEEEMINYTWNQTLWTLDFRSETEGFMTEMKLWRRVVCGAAAGEEDEPERHPHSCLTNF